MTVGSLVSLQFSKREDFIQEVTVSPPPILQPQQDVDTSAVTNIIDALENALKDAAGEDVAVVDLGKGADWWETRLFLLCAGAARRGRPTAIVFVATVSSGRRRVFQGWAPPAELAQQLLAKREDLHDPYNKAYDEARPPIDESREALLANELAQIEMYGRHGVITVSRLHELFKPVLRTSVDLDQENVDDLWIRTVLSTTDRFIAVTHGDDYKGLQSRDEAVNDILRALVDVISGDSTAAGRARS